MNTIVSYELAKLLKEKGFNKPCKWYMKDGVTLSESNETNDYLITGYYSAPTIAEVVMWMYEKHGLWISVSVNPKIERFISNIYENHLYKCSIYGQTNERHENGWDTPTEAYQSAIEYCLNNLINQ